MKSFILELGRFTLELVVFALLLFGIITVATYLTPAYAADWSMGVHTVSFHVPARDYQRNSNPGLNLQWKQVRVGFYENTLGRTSGYAGWVEPVGPVDVLVGLVSGYQKKCTISTTVIPERVYRDVQANSDTSTTTHPAEVHSTEDCVGYSRHAVTPMVAFSATAPFQVLGASPELTLIPPMPKTSTVLHLSFRWSFK